jgi:CopA family copper-resistance protein
MIKKFSMPNSAESALSRRQFVTGAAAGGLLLSTGAYSRSLRAELPAHQPPQTLQGNQFDLGIGYREVNFTGTPRQATVVNGGLPAPVLRWKQGEEVVLRVTNNLAVDSSIHWHGIILPSGMDGVPRFSFPGIKPGETFTYRFPVQQSGTYWYHSHSGFQEQTGVYGAIVIDPAEPEPFSYDRDYVVTLSDWSDTKPERIFSNLKKLGHYYNFQQRTMGDFARQVGEEGWGDTIQDRAMWWQMRMSDRDVSDVTGYTYTFLTNGMTPDDNWTGLFSKGERIRLRFINAAAMTNFDVRIPGLKMTVVAADGQYVKPVSVDEFRIGVAETYDVIVEPQEGAYTVFAQAIDRSGYARGTLAEQSGMAADIPALDPPVILSHADMGMAHDMDHGMDHSAQGGSQSAAGEMDHSQMQMGKMDHSQHDNASMLGKAGFGSTAPVVHASTENGFQVDMQAEMARDQLGNPGIGLAGNGRRVLTYADLRNLNPTPDPREPEREIQLHLTGNMSRYMWSMNGIRFSDAEPLPLTLNERVRITLVNDTMMNHPIHLHGMWSDLETGDPDYIPRKHTILVQPGSTVSYLVTPEMPGDWAYHCHLLYHMRGMFRRVRVSAKGAKS